MTSKSEFARSLVLLGKGAACNGANEFLVGHWEEFEVPAGHQSIPLLVEEQIEGLRQEYLAWVHDLGDCQLGGRSLRENLCFDGQFSFWWMTLIAEKSPVKSPAIHTVFKLRVLERLYLSSGCHGIILYSGDRRLHQVLATWCQRLGHPYRWHRQTQTSERPGLRPYLQRLPHPLQAMVFVVNRLWNRWRHLPAIKKVPTGGRQATIVTYFPNIDLTMAPKGIFRSRYWGGLHRLLDRGPWLVNWIWLYVKSDECSLHEAMEWRQRFDAQAADRSRHYFLEEFIGVRGLFRALHLYFRLLGRSFSLKGVRQNFHFPGSQMNFWPILATDWQKSLTGTVAMNACLLLMASHSVVQKLPHQEWGLYSWENQPWERSLAAAWRESGNGHLIGFQHVSGKYLDLRGYEDPRSYKLAKLSPPLPDLLAVGGAGSMEMLLQAGFPRERCVLVEALRYMYLCPLLGQGTKRDIRRPTGTERPTLLAITSSSASETAAQLHLLAQAAQRGALDGYVRILVKPHPDLPVNGILKQVAPDLKVSLVQEPLTSLWPQAPVVYTANSTSASVEAGLMGLPLLIHVVEDKLNLSPLLGNKGVVHVATVADLVKGLQAPQSVDIRPDYFCLEEGLPRWKLLGY